MDVQIARAMAIEVAAAGHAGEATGKERTRPETIAAFFAAIVAGDAPTLLEILTPDAVTRWPQTGEQITSAMSCLRVYQTYPGGPPAARVERVSGAGDTWVAELVAQYGDERWYTVSIVEFDGPRIARMTDYFGPTLPAPDWRKDLVDKP